MNTTELIARPVRNWVEAVMRTCDYCSHHKMTVLNSDGSAICASCSDAENVTNLLNAVEIYQTRNAELVEALESAQRKIAELEARAVTVRLPVTFWYEHDDLSRDVAVLDKRLVKKAIRDACECAGIKCEVKGE